MRKNLLFIMMMVVCCISAVAQNPVGQRVIYEMNVGSFTGEGTFSAAQARLDYLKDTGIDIIWLMPVYPRGSSKSPYAVMDFEATNSAYGTVDDLKSLVKAAHEKGMKVILDWVPNQTANEHPWRQTHPAWYTGKHSYADISDLNYDNEEMKAEMNRIMKQWIELCDIDGFRFDFVTNTKPSYWLTTNKELKDFAASKGKDELILLAEIDTNDGTQNQRFSNKTNNIGFTHDYAWWLQETVLRNGFAKNSNLSTLKQNLQKFVNDSKTLGLSRMVYLTNHDQNWNDGGATLSDMYGYNRYALTVLEFTLYGMPLIYNGQEIGGSQKLDYFNDTKIDWNNSDEKMQSLIKQLSELKHTMAALNDQADVEFIDAGTDALAYKRKSGDSSLTVVLNLGNSQTTVTVNGVSYTLTAHDYKWTAEGPTLGITTNHLTPSQPNPYTYTLSGQRVTGKAPKGIYIRNGKKYVKQ